MSGISSRRSRKFFFWPFRPWFLGRQRVTSMEGGVSGTIYGGFGPDGFHVGGGIDGGVRGTWIKQQ